MKILKITSILLLTITIFCVLFIRIVPDYSNKYGFEIVTLNDYKKYKLGYCLKEDRILSKDEIYRRAIIGYIDKSQRIFKKAEILYCNNVNVVLENFCHPDDINKIKYYEMIDYTNENLVKKFQNYFYKFNYDNNISYKENYTLFFYKAFNLRPITFSTKDFIVNLKDDVAGFTRPILFYKGGETYQIYTDKSFAFLNKKSFVLRYMYLFDTTSSTDKYYKKTPIEVFNKEVKAYKKILQNERFYIGPIYLIDNCGFLNLDIEENAREIADSRLNGGG